MTAEFVTNQLTLSEVELDLCRRSLRSFVKMGWKRVEPKPFVDGWHIGAVCEHLQAVTEGQIRNLIINIPPRHTKSMVVSVMWLPWEWGPAKQPGTRWLFNSYGQRLTTRDSVKCRNLINSNWYQELWGSCYYLVSDQNQKTRYDNNHGGSRIATSVEGMGTGEGGERIVVDDPISLKEIHSEAALQNVIDWWRDVIPTRSNDPKTGSKVIIMQRGSEKDLTGYLLEHANEEYEKLILPAEFEPKYRCKTSLGFTDPRTKPGELLWPERFGKEELKSMKKELGSFNYTAQFQQRPTPAEGGIIKRSWWHRYGQRPVDLVAEMDQMFQSWDMSFKGLKDSDFVVGQVWGIKGAKLLLFDQVRERMSYTESKRAIRNLTSKWPDAEAKYVEDKANGPAVIDDLKESITGLIPFNPEGSKESRVYSVSPTIEAGNVVLPIETYCPWVEGFIEEFAAFPMGANDDQVDSATQGIIVGRRLMNKRKQWAPVESFQKHSEFAGVLRTSAGISGRSKWRIGSDD